MHHYSRKSKEKVSRPIQSSSEAVPAEQKQSSQHTGWRSLFDWFQAATFSPDWVEAPWSRPATGYALALLGQLAIVVLVALLGQIFPTLCFCESLLLLVVFLVAWGWGAAPALIATCAGAVGLLLLWLPSSTTPAVSQLEHILRFLLYMGAGITLGTLTSRIQQARYTAQAFGQRMEEIIDALPDPLVFYDAQGEVVQYNRSARELEATEQRDASVAEMPTHVDMHDTAGKPLTAHDLPLARALRGEVVTDVELRYSPPTGAPERTILMSGTPLRAQVNDSIIGAVTITHDLSALRLAEYEATGRARQLEATFNAMTDGVVIYDSAGQIQRFNEAYNKLIALDKAPEHRQATPAERAEMLAVRDEHGSILSPEHQPVQRMLAGEVFTANQAIDIQVHTLDGRDVQLNITGTPMYDQEHALTGGVLIFRDVTERRALERRTQEALEALLTMAEDLVHLPEQAEHSEAATKMSNGISKPLAELIRRVLGCERVAVTAIDQTTHELHSLTVVGISPEQEQLWYARESGFHLSELLEGTSFSPHQNSNEPVVVDFTQPPLCNLPNPFGIQTMILTPLKIGSRQIGVLALDYGTSTHVYTPAEITLTRAVADLSALVIERERLQREQAMAQASVLALHETNRMMDEFIGIAGHELRTPLTTVKASVQLANRQLARLLSQPDALPATIDKQLAIVKSHLDRTERQVGMQNRLVRDLLDVSRIHADRLELHPELCDLANLVREVVEDQHYLTAQRTIDLSIHTPDEILVLADADRIRQVINNYLSNALKYSEASKPVQISVNLLDTQVQVSISDEGPGLAPEQQQRIWERFYRAPGIEVRTGSGVGLGLGLHISRTIIERHDGHFGVHSDPPHGSTFWFTLPLAEQKPM
ncbi:MAG: PAS domain-containing protein [Ktedonobacteraceae bacterium]|nr:PAS domain-containing protein [Ktedonobacteraceae bacterium]